MNENLLWCMKLESDKSLSRQGSRRSALERVVVLSLFLHRTSVVRVNLSRLIHNTADPAGQSPHQSMTSIAPVAPVVLLCAYWGACRPWVLTVPHREGFHLQPATLSPSKTVILSLKALKPGTDLASWWMKVSSCIHFQIGRFHPYGIFALASNYPPQSTYLWFQRFFSCLHISICRHITHFTICDEWQLLIA